jgi:DNA-binding CsgD family transcriptional regulator
MEVCARTIVGMTAEGISIDLGIAHPTVLTYRRRAYARYGVSSAHELMGRLLA